MQSELKRMSCLTWQFIYGAGKPDSHPIVNIQHYGVTEDGGAVTRYVGLVHVIHHGVVVIVVLVLLLRVVLVALHR